MLGKFIESTMQRPQGSRTMDGQLVNIDLNRFMNQIRNERKWNESDRNAITVFKANGMRIVLIALHKGAQMVRHTANGIINLQVIEGKILFQTDDESNEMNIGNILVLHEGIEHSVMAIEDSIFLLTLTTTLSDN